jgi:pSer/pThr/pTyr-binding forkhead associated (FHA) protein
VITIILLHPTKSTPLQNWTFEDDSAIAIGRAVDNQVVLYSAVVSRRHVQISPNGKGWVLENLGANGTYIEGKTVEKIEVTDGMIISLASSGPKIQIRLEESEIEPKLSLQTLKEVNSQLPAGQEKETMTS